MKIGLLVRYSKEDLELVQEVGLGSIELLAWPGDPLNADNSDDEWKKAADDIRGRGLEVSALGSYHNLLDTDGKKRKSAAEYMGRLLGKAARINVPVVGAFAGRDPEKSVKDNMPGFKKAWTPLAKKAEDLGVKIAFENCPMFHGFPFRGVNIAFTPAAWDMMFDAVPSDAVGLEYDPSHLICLLIDPVKVIYDYGSKIHHVHAKDAEVVWRNVEKVGIMGPGAVRHRTPGMGDTPWGKLISALVEVGYEGNLDIEGRHDPVYGKEREEEGLVIARKHLEQFVVGT